MKLTINLDDDWLQVPGYLPEGLLRAVKEHEGISTPPSSQPELPPPPSRFAPLPSLVFN
jgi:hypothetical protein